MKKMMGYVTLTLLAVPGFAVDAVDVWDEVDHHWAKNGDLKIHYTTLGEGKPVLFIHGFPDIWYSWRHQMAALSGDFKTAAMDLRGYNQSSQPEGIENYELSHILTDVMAVIDDLGADKVTLVGHDWGGAIAWRFAMQNPERIEHLVILNLTHPKGYANVIANPTSAQKQNTEYARRFASSPPDGSPVPDRILGIGYRSGDPVVGAHGAHYREALGRSSYDAMVNYYRANYGRLADGQGGELPNLQMSVLQFHGLKDNAVDKDGLKDTWNWVDEDYTLVTVPSSGHFVQWEAAELVSETLRLWLLARQ